MPKTLIILILSSIIFSCQKKENAYIDQAIAAHGGNSYDTINVKLAFRGLDYEFKRDGGNFNYQRIQEDSLGSQIKDVLTNNEFHRFINNEEVHLADTMAQKYENSVNSVAYFFLLPYGLNDPAVNKTYEKDILINGTNYHQIKIWFNQEGGGQDHQDIYKFWINAETKMLDFLAYSYETSGGGVRFREAINRKKVGNFLFQDYNNYGYEDLNIGLDQLPADFENGSLPFLSKIENESITLMPKTNQTQ